MLRLWGDLGIPFRIYSRITEEIPVPQPIIVTEYKIAHYICPCCRKEVFASDPGCSHEDKFGIRICTYLSTLLLFCAKAFMKSHNTISPVFLERQCKHILLRNTSNNQVREASKAEPFVVAGVTYEHAALCTQ